MTYSCTIKIKIHIPAITTFMTKLKVNIQKLLALLDLRQRGPIKSLLLVIGWLVTQFFQKRL